MPAKSQRGFTLMEAIVALVLISATGMALFGWINSSLGSLARLRDADARAEATVNALEYMNSVNPMLIPEGRADLGAYRIRWRAAAATAAQDGANYPQGISLYQLALYDTAIRVEKMDGSPWFELTLRQVGFKKVRELRLPF